MLLIHVGGWSLTRGGRTWRFGRYMFLSVYDIGEITLDVEIRFSAVLSGFSGSLAACVCPLLV